MGGEAPSSSKEEIVAQLLSEGDVMLCLDARQADVKVPPAHKNDPGLRLIVNLKFPASIQVTLEGVSATLSFNGRPFPCFIPFSALWAAYNPHSFKGVVWTSHVPVEVQREILQEPDTVLSMSPQVEVQKPGPALKVLAGGKRKRKTLPGKSTRGHLRLIK